MSEFDKLKQQKDEIVARDKGEVAVAIGLAVYARMVRLAHDGNQTVGEKRDYYVTLAQLEEAFISLRNEVKILRCQEMHSEGGQCELRAGHQEKHHLAGTIWWSGKP